MDLQLMISSCNFLGRELNQHGHLVVYQPLNTKLFQIKLYLQMDLVLIISSCGCKNLVLVLLSIWAIQGSLDSNLLRKRVQAHLLVLRYPCHFFESLFLRPTCSLLRTSQDLVFELCLYHLDSPMKILFSLLVLEYQISSVFCTSQDLE